MSAALLHRLRLVGLLEGVTLLLLLLVAVPLKHAAGLPQAVSVIGPIHGLVFILYAVTLIEAISAGGWTRRAAVLAVLACLLPFGTFLNDRRLRAMRPGLAPGGAEA